MRIDLTVNGTEHQIDASPYARLLDILRGELGLTGTKEGCGEGECGACTVLIDGELANACLIPVGQVHGRDVATIEGLSGSGSLHAVQRALVDHGGTQCGFCTPGIALAAANAIEREPGASRARLRQLLAGNLCRCTGYQLVIDAVVAAREEGAP